MAVYFKFKSAKDFDSVPIDGHFIAVGHLKEKIFESKHLGRGTDFDPMVSNAQTNEDMQWRMPQDLAAESFGMPIGLSTYNPYWGGMQWGMDGYMAPYGNTMPYMDLTPDPFALPFGAGMGGQGYRMPGVPPPRRAVENASGSCC